MVARIEADTSFVLTATAWAEAEIAEAAGRHPGQADLLYHAFRVLAPPPAGPGMSAEFVYRGHVRELLNRVVAGLDLRPATATEICLTLAQASAQVPLHGPAAGLYFRIWLAAFPDQPVTPDQADNQRHYEHLYGEQIDNLEATLRRKAADPARQLGAIQCRGRHHGTDVTCRFAASDHG